MCFSCNLKERVLILVDNFMWNMWNNGSRLDIWHVWSFKGTHAMVRQWSSWFVLKVMEQAFYKQDDGIRCPCVKCDCGKILKLSYVRAHLLEYGFKSNYRIWVDDNEEWSNEDNLCDTSSNYANINCVY